MNRRLFIGKTTATTAGMALGLHGIHCSAAAPVKPALLGGPRSFEGAWPSWPIYDHTEESELTAVLHSKKWGRLGGEKTAKFEAEHSEMYGAKHTLAVTSGTAALYTMLGALDIGPGDEIIIPPYTFIATYNVVTLNYALPVFADSDIESFQMDPSEIEKHINANTKAIVPVHIGGLPADLDRIGTIALKHNIPVLEDACQAHLAEWKGKCVGNYGLAGAFSFQATKNLNSGEGGAIITNDTAFYERCFSFHHQGQSANTAALEPGTGTRGSNLRITEFQSALLSAQMKRLAEQTNLRHSNALYLNEMMEKIEGITPARIYRGVTKGAFHLYMFRYNKDRFSGLSREKFLKALKAEDIPCSAGYGSLPDSSYIQSLAVNKYYRRIYGEKRMSEWLEQIKCPKNLQLTGEAVWLFQNTLLGSRQDMEKIVEAVAKIKRYAGELNKM